MQRSISDRQEKKWFCLSYMLAQSAEVKHTQFVNQKVLTAYICQGAHCNKQEEHHKVFITSLKLKSCLS